MPSATTSVSSDATSRLTRLVLVVGLPPFVVVLVAIGTVGRSLLALLLGVVVGAAVAAGAIAWLWRSAPLTFDRHLELVAPDPISHARLLNLVDNLGAVIGLAEPRVMMVHDPGVNGAVIGHLAHSPTVVVTRGLVDHLERVELEGALAWLLARARDPRLWTDTFAAAVLAVPAARVGLDGPVARSVAPLAGSPEMIATVDLAAVAATRFPPGLAGALSRVADHGSAVAGVPTGTEWLWLADPRAPDAIGDGPVTHPVLDHRIEVLREL